MLLAISEYLSLNDAVAIFSLDVLPLLWTYNLKLPVIDPSEEFLSLMTETNHLDKIIGLHVQADRFKSMVTSISSGTFVHTQSVRLQKLCGRGNLPGIRLHFPHITFISLLYYEQVHCQRLCQIFNIIPPSIHCLTVRCPSIQCSHHTDKFFFVRLIEWNTTIQTFILHVKSTASLLVEKCFKRNSHCLLNTILQFIELMQCVRDVRIIIEDNIETLLNLAEWTNFLDNYCQKLVRIKLKGKRSPFFNEQSWHALREIRPSIDFKIEVS